VSWHVQVHCCGVLLLNAKDAVGAMHILPVSVCMSNSNVVASSVNACVCVCVQICYTPEMPSQS